MQFSHGYSRDAPRTEGEKEGGERSAERAAREGKKKLFDVGSEALRQRTMDRGVDSRLLDFRQSNFANETYPVTQLVPTRACAPARTCTRVHAN